MQDELVSIIVSVFNIEQYLPMCLESISRQTYDNLEILLIDDGSNDGSGIICDAFVSKDSRARVIHQDNQGVWAVRNRGQAEARGDYLAFIDGDDYFHKDYVRFLYEAINLGGHRHPLSICGYKRTRDDNEDTSSEMRPAMTEMDQDQIIEQFFSPDRYTTFTVNWNKLYRKESLEKPFQRAYLRCQDMDSNLKAFLTTIDEAVMVESVLYYWRIRSGQLTGTLDNLSIRNRCISLILYDNHIKLPDSKKSYDHYLLMALYRRMATWMSTPMETEERQKANGTVKEIKTKTAFDFLFCKHEPMSYKIGLLLVLDFPSFRKLLLSLKRAYTVPLNSTKY